MKLLIKGIQGEHYWTHGFGALMNKALYLCSEHYRLYGNWDIEIEDFQIQNIFETNTVKGDFYTRDLIWDTGVSIPENNKEAYKNVFKIKSPIDESLVAELGIHARGTDKETEFPRVKLERIIEYINEVNPKSIFLATDDNYFLQPLKERFGDRLKYDKNAIISMDGKPIHHNIQTKRDTNIQAFTSAYILSKCKSFAFCSSNLSRLALTMGDFETTINLNT